MAFNKMSKTNVQANTRKGKMYKVCPKCGGNMVMVKKMGFGVKTSFNWTCECGESYEQSNGHHLKNNLVRNK